MDAVKFLQERKRMCAERPCCACPVYATGQGCAEDDNPELEVATVEEWAAAHPRRTRQSVFLEQWPNAQLDCCGIVKICPSDIDTTIHQNCSADKCGSCRREFWMQEVK